MKAPSTIEEFQKSQAIRVWDMIFVAPVLTYAGMVKSNLPDSLRVTLVFMGIATFIYNANNYFKNESQYSLYQQVANNSNS
jgi:hypothetical protein